MKEDNSKDLDLSEFLPQLLLARPAILQVIDRDLERLQAIRLILSDPEALSLFDSYRKGIGKRVVPSRSYPNEDLLALIRTLLAQEYGVFTTRSLQNDLRSAGCDISSYRLAQALLRLEHRKEIRLLERGRGRPTRYEQVQPLSPAAESPLPPNAQSGFLQ